MLPEGRRPRVAEVPPSVASSGLEVVEFSAEVGLVLDDWQGWFLERGLGERGGPEGRWAATEVGLLVGRQNGKSALFVARALAGLFLLGEELVIFTSHEFKTNAECFLLAKALIDGSADLSRDVKTIRTSHGEEGVELTSGARLRFLARSRSSARGFSCDCLILDEAFALTSVMMSAVFSTGSARANRQIWYGSMAGDERSGEWARIRKRGHEGGKRLCWIEWSAPEGADLDDEQVWAASNPGYPHRLSREAIEDERAALSDADFARERLGIWGGGDRARIIPVEVWREVQDIEAGPAGGIRLGVDMSPDRSSAAIVAYGAGSFELVEWRRGVGWLAEAVTQIAVAQRATVVVDGTGPAASIAGELETGWPSGHAGVRGTTAKVTVERLSGPQVASASARLYDAIHSRTVRVRPHAGLDQAVAGAAKRPVGDRFVWSRTASLGDVTPLLAASIAYGPAPARPQRRPARVTLPSRRVPQLGTRS